MHSLTSPSRALRGVTGALGVTAVLLALAACGSDDAGATTTPAADTTAAPDTTAAADTTAVPDTTAAAPDTTTPATTEAPALDADAPHLGKVVALAEEVILADVMALGITPIASSATVDAVGFQGMDGFDTAGIEVLAMTTLSVEYLASLQPDTIITLQYWVDTIGADILEGIADVVVVPDGLTGAERITTIGRLTGRPEHAAAVAADLAAAQAAAAELVPDDCTLSLAAVYAGPSVAAFVDGIWELPAAIESVGCTLDPGRDAGEADRNGRLWLSEEQYTILDQDLLVLMQTDTVEGEPESLAQLAGHPLWATLPAVVAGNVVTFDRLGYPGAAGSIRFYEDFAALFTGG